MAFMSGELKYYYDLLIEIGHPITASRAARLFRMGELANYVQDVIDALLPPACALGDKKCVEFDLYECQEVLGSPQWVRIERGSEECGYVPPPDPEDIKAEGIILYQARLDAFFVWGRTEEIWEEARDYLDEVADEWLYAQYQWDKYRGFLDEWLEAEDAYWHNKSKIDRLLRDKDDLEYQLSDLFTQISDWYTELFAIQDAIDDWEYMVEKYEDDVAYAQDLVDQKARDLEDCLAEHGWRIAECMDFQEAWLEAKELLEDLQEWLEDAQANLSFYEIQFESLMRQVNDAWDEVNDVQAEIADIEDEIEDIMGVLADLDTIEEQIDRFTWFVDYWHSEMWYWEDQMEIAEIRQDAALWDYENAEREWNNARRAWSAFKKKYPAIAQEILDEWGT